jgi:hypothetical protein
MRARTITTILVLGALAIPASASANVDYSTLNAITGGSSEPSQQTGGSDYSSVNSISPPASEPSVLGHGDPSPPDPGYSSLNAITGPSTEAPTFVSAAPASGDQFDWGDAALGAAAALALIAFGGAALLTVRRRMPVSPSASTS